ncbi:hypothetical protein MSAN_02420700 [Mycena sanguinolenta]|uniref:Cell wall galactomannoprotein n=1 Tax=Mycena sanguinolenta TaxID=230812 RepID=A0A8H6X304_9AGAR|nr:hypothetical protein MSAN_02420700 [Mycena sanguinolenta]
MKLSIAATLATLASLAVPTTLAQLAPTQIVAAIYLVSNISQNARDVLSPLSTSADRATVETAKQTLVNNLNTIINELQADTSGLEKTAPIDDGAAIVAALDSFVGVDRAFLRTVVRKHVMFAQFQVTPPIAAALRALEVATDTFLYALSNMVPQKARRAIERRLGTISSDQAALDTALGDTITVYSQQCTPSPLYPVVLPFCGP